MFKRFKDTKVEQLENSSSDYKEDVIFFNCDTELKKQFYKVIKDKEVNADSILRKFLRKFIKENS